MWVEADCNIPSGESLVRQIVHGKRFYLEEFGIETNDVWLPDVFGYSAALPQIMQQGGVRWFLTQKLSWNQYNVLPHHSFYWEGIDGSRVFTHFPPADTYDGNISVRELRFAVENFKDHDRAGRSLYPFGWGDGGGGPTAEMLESARRLAGPRGPAPDRHGGPAGLLQPRRRPSSRDPPVWVGELYLELHRGTYTSQAATKLGNRRAEFALREAELWSSLGPGVPVPGGRARRRCGSSSSSTSSTTSSRGRASTGSTTTPARDHARVLAEAAERLADEALSALVADVDTSGPGHPVVVFNSLSHPRTELVAVEAPDGVATATVAPRAPPARSSSTASAGRCSR